jgi:hypothetical protein
VPAAAVAFAAVAFGLVVADVAALELTPTVTSTHEVAPVVALATGFVIATAEPLTAAASTPLTATRPAPTPAPSPTRIAVGRVTAIGDSVMLGAARELRRRIAAVEIDAAVSRQTNAAIRLLQAHGEAGRLGEFVVVHIGNNGPITATQFDRLMQPLVNARLVVFVNLRVPRPWESRNNAVLADGVKRYPNAVLLDWNGYLNAHPDLIGRDGTHLGTRSARAYTALVVNALLAPRETPALDQLAPTVVPPR